MPEAAVLESATAQKAGYDIHSSADSLRRSHYDWEIEHCHECGDFGKAGLACVIYPEESHLARMQQAGHGQGPGPAWGH